jgi:hypothetical protein
MEYWEDVGISEIDLNFSTSSGSLFSKIKPPDSSFGCPYLLNKVEFD